MISIAKPDSTPQILWRTKYAAAYKEDQHMVIRYRFPYSRKREAALLGTYDLKPTDRLPYYQTLSSMLERNFAIIEYLQAEAVPSILTFKSAFQKQENHSIICIYGIPEEPVTPISQSLFASDCNALTALSIFLRLTHILRDINKLSKPLALRYLDLDDVYITNNNMVLLGGFYYADTELLQAPTAYLPDAAPVIPEEIRNGSRGNIGTDMQILSQIAWNVFSGLPWDCAHTPLSRAIPPSYAPPALLATLELGLTGNPEAFNQFRKRLMQCHKDLAKTDFAAMTIPLKKPQRKLYHFETPSALAPNDTKTASAPNG